MINLQGKKGKSQGKSQGIQRAKGQIQIDARDLLWFVRVPFLTHHRKTLWSLKIQRANSKKISAKTHFSFFVKTHKTKKVCEFHTFHGQNCHYLINTSKTL